MTIERNRYFTGELLDVADLAQEQRYFLQKARRHNRMLHGWGIVCGLGIRAGAAAGQVTVEPGYARPASVHRHPLRGVRDTSRACHGLRRVHPSA